MKFLFGMITAIILSVLLYVGLMLMAPKIGIEKIVGGENVRAIFNAVIEDNSSEDSLKIDEENQTDNLENNDQFIDGNTGEVINDDRQVFKKQYILENIRLIVIETPDYRLHAQELSGLPETINLAIWPDSVLVEDVYPFYLLMPPTDRMAAFKLTDIVTDIDNDYQYAFEAAEGLFFDKFAPLLQETPLSNAVYEKMASLDKQVMVHNNYVDPKLNKIITAYEVDFDQVNYLLDTTNEEETAQQWSLLLDRAKRGEDIVVALYATPSALTGLKTILTNDDAIH